MWVVYVYSNILFKPSHLELTVNVWQLYHLLHVMLKLLNETGWVPFTFMHLEDFFSSQNEGHKQFVLSVINIPASVKLQK